LVFESPWFSKKLGFDNLLAYIPRSADLPDKLARWADEIAR
jgi:hypothetical protein